MEYTNSQISFLIGEHVHSQRDRDVLLSRFVDGMTYERIGEKYDLSTVQVKRIVRREQARIFKMIQE